MVICFLPPFNSISLDVSYKLLDHDPFIVKFFSLMRYQLSVCVNLSQHFFNGKANHLFDFVLCKPFNLITLFQRLGHHFILVGWQFHRHHLGFELVDLNCELFIPQVICSLQKFLGFCRHYVNLVVFLDYLSDRHSPLFAKWSLNSLKLLIFGIEFCL